MLKKFLKVRNRGTTTGKPEGNSSPSYLYKSLFEFLIGRISVPGKAEQLIQLGYKSAGKKAEEAFHTYLLFEKYLTSFEQTEQYTRQSLRESVRMRFPGLLQEPIFNLLYVSETEQKNTLATQFLQSFLDNLLLFAVCLCGIITRQLLQNKR